MSAKSMGDKGRPRILALDLDGTLLSYDGNWALNEFGEVLRGWLEELGTLRENGWKIVIWSCRTDTAELRAHLDAQEVPYDYINEHPWNGSDNPRKIQADVYVDDKAISFEGIPTGMANRIMNFQAWWKSPWV